jgi:AcrR family transcriptional regulator
MSGGGHDEADGRVRRPPARGRGRPAGHDAAETRAAIIGAAQRRFGLSGYRGASMDAIAADCGLNARAIYYHFPSKRALFDACAAEEFARFGGEVVERVFAHDSLRERVRGYIDVYRSLHAADPHRMPFVGRVLLDMFDRMTVAEGAAAPAADGDAHLLAQLLERLVDDAMARGEVNPALERQGALQLLAALGMGIALASLDEGGDFAAMLDALDLLTEGTLFVDGDR